MLCFSSVCCFHFYVCVLFLFLGMSKVDTPSPHSSRKHDKKCGSCHNFLSELDPHPVCQKCVPRGCSRESPCSHLCPPLSQDAWKKWERQQASKGSSSSTKGPKGDSAKGGNKPGKVSPDVPSTPKAESPGRLRLAALESSFRTEMASMFASLTGRLTVSHPPDPKAGGSRHCDGGAHSGEICPSRELEDPLASQQPFTGLLGPEALPLVGRAPGCDLSEPSQVMEPRGTASHAATAMDPVHGSQWSVSSTNITLTAQQGAVLRSSCGSDGMGEVSTGTASMSFTGRRSQPMDAARQLLLVDDSALSGHSGPPGPLGPPGPVISLSCRTWGYPHGSGNGAGPGRPPRLPGPAGPKEHFPSGYFSPARGPAFSLGSQATPGIHRHPYGVRGIFRAGANTSHQAGTAPPLWWN